MYELNMIMQQPEINLHGYQTAKDYAKGKGWQTNKYVYQLVRAKKIDFVRVKELNNLLLVCESVDKFDKPLN